ncbi:MAG: ArnT family glycosyltransferase [Myxococcales bacterium]
MAGLRLRGALCLLRLLEGREALRPGARRGAVLSFGFRRAGRLWDWLSARPSRAAWVAAGLAFALALPALGNLDGLGHPDETFYLSIAADMADHGEIVPAQDGVIVYQKPPLVFWLARLLMVPFGRNAAAARLAGALSAAALCGAGALFAAALFGAAAAPPAGFFLAGSYGTLRFGRALMLDLPLAASLAFAMTCLTLALERDEAQQDNGRYLFAAGLSGALALGIKGEIGPGLLVLAAVPLLVWRRRLGLLGRAPFWAGIGLGLCVSLPWYVYLLAEHARDFWTFHVVDQYLDRFEGRHGQPALGLLWGTLLYAAPFVPLAAVGLARAVADPGSRRRAAAALCWIGAFVVLFGLPKEHGLHYPLLILPPLAALAALAARERSRVAALACGISAIAAFLTGAFFALLLALPLPTAAVAAACTAMLCSGWLWFGRTPLSRALASGVGALGLTLGIAGVGPALGGPLLPPAAREAARAGAALDVAFEHPGPVALEAGRPARQLWSEEAVISALKHGDRVFGKEHWMKALSPAARELLSPVATWRRTRPYLSWDEVARAWKRRDLDALRETYAIYELAQQPAASPDAATR